MLQLFVVLLIFIFPSLSPADIFYLASTSCQTSWPSLEHLTSIPRRRENYSSSSPLRASTQRRCSWTPSDLSRRILRPTLPRPLIWRWIEMPPPLLHLHCSPPHLPHSSTTSSDPRPFVAPPPWRLALRHTQEELAGTVVAQILSIISHYLEVGVAAMLAQVA